ncbi:MAG: hypothetical protein ACQEW8_06640 [Actinomycetota bacterium]
MTIADELLCGPRGRRLCLGYVGMVDEAIWRAVSRLGQEFDPHPTSAAFGWATTAVVEDPTFTEADVAERIRRTDLTSIPDDAARQAMHDTVDVARYWQEPDGGDMVAALPAVRDALSSVADRLGTLMPDLTAPFTTAQWTVDWRVASDSAPIERSPSEALARWTSEQREEEERTTREHLRDPRANYTGMWWSVPQQLLQTRSKALYALHLVEDFSGWEVATLIPVHGAGRILEIESADDWATLCREYPMEVTASRRHDWFRVTGRDGGWLIPDWERVAQRWDAVHLTTLGYLSSATKQIDVDGEYTTVIAGWAPDSTIWLTDVARERDEPRQQWHRRDHDNRWVPDDRAGAHG